MKKRPNKKKTHYNNSKFKDEMNEISSQIHICLKSSETTFGRHTTKSLTLNLDTFPYRTDRGKIFHRTESWLHSTLSTVVDKLYTTSAFNTINHKFTRQLYDSIKTVYANYKSRSCRITMLSERWATKPIPPFAEREHSGSSFYLMYKHSFIRKTLEIFSTNWDFYLFGCVRVCRF